jgi:hypothetical protein
MQRDTGAPESGGVRRNGTGAVRRPPDESADAWLNGVARASEREPPRIHLIVASALGGVAETRRNLCSIVGTLRGGTGDVVLDSPRYRLAVNEVLSGESGMVACRYQLEITIGGRLADPGMVQDGARVAISGALRMAPVRTVGGIIDDLDLPIPPTWEMRLDAIAVTAVDAATPDGSWVQLEGRVGHPPLVRDYAIGPGVALTMVQTYLRCRSVVQSAFGGGGRYVHLTVVPVEGVLDEETPDMAALLLPDNLVRLEGRLRPVIVRRRAHDPRVAAAIRQIREHVRGRATGAVADARIQSAVEAYLHGVRMVIDVGSVELVHGRMPGPDEQRRIIKAARHGRAAAVLERKLTPDAIRSALDTAQAAWWAAHTAATDAGTS